ncbi:MAG: 16S rRNA methyltransferase [Anaerolineales bacterium]
MDELVSELTARVLSSRKYAHTSRELVTRLVREELSRGRKPKEVVKAVRNKLHQVGGAYQVQAPQYDVWLKWLQEAGTPEELRSVCRAVMGMHASTKERLSILDEIYAGIFKLLPPIHTVLDAACGLNPLALPWMPLGEDTRYFACDIYADMVAFLNGFFELVPQTGTASVCDLVASPPDQQVDLALVMKSIPCLEQIDKQAGTRLLGGLRSRYLAVSFPAKSLGGRSKGMVENYSARFEELIAGRGWQLLGDLAFATELVFVVDCDG